MSDPPPLDLLALKKLLHGRNASRPGPSLDAGILAAAYRAFIPQAPSRKGRYLSH